MSAERLRLLASFEALRRHERNGDDDGFGVRDGHKDEFATCPHPDCLLVRSALGDTGRATPADETLQVVLSHWFIQGGEAQYGKLLVVGREPQNADELVSAILARVRATPATLPLLDLDAYADEIGAHFMASDNTLESERASIRPILQRLVLAAVRAPSGEGRWQPLTRDDIAQIIEGIEHFCIGPIENAECRAIWQPYIDKLRALAAEPLAAQGWQPIETAPKDVNYMLVASPAHGLVIGAHVTGDCWHLVGVGVVTSASERPTHWQPLPAPPGSGDGPRQLISQEDLPPEAAKALRDHAWELIGDGPPPCESECNPYVAPCGARFCTDEARQQHELTCGAVPRWQRFNDSTGALSWNHRSAAEHPDRCVCQGDDTTPHKHYDDDPRHGCARCSKCKRYRPAVGAGAVPPPEEPK